MSRETAGFLLGCALLTVSTFTIAVGGYSPNVVSFLDKWQTLITGALAVFGAWLTVGAVREQIKSSEAVEERRRLQEVYAARAVLPASLSLLTEYAQSCMRLMEQLVDDGSLCRRPPGYLVPSIPSEALEAIRNCIRFADPARAKEMADLLHWLQIQNSRICALGFRSNDYPDASPYEIYRRILDAAELHARTSALFDYGRRLDEGDLQRVGSKEIRTALRVTRIYKEHHTMLGELLDAQDSNEPGWPNAR